MGVNNKTRPLVDAIVELVISTAEAVKGAEADGEFIETPRMRDAGTRLEKMLGAVLP